MRFLLSVFLISNLVFFIGCKTTTEEEPTVASSPAKPLEEPKEEVEERKPQTIIVPTGSLGNISEVQKKMLEKTLESALDEHFSIISKDVFEEAQEKAFEELNYDECTEDQCIMMIKEILQVENAFQLVLMEENGDTQISLTWNDLDYKKVEEEYCEGCKTKQLRESITGLVEKMVVVKDVDNDEIPMKIDSVLVETPEVVANLNQGIIRTKYFWNGSMWVTDGDPIKEGFYVGEIKDGKRNGEGTYRSQDGRIFRGEFKDDKLWNIREHLRGKLIGTWKNGKKY